MITEHQLQALGRLADSLTGCEGAPGGYSTAGRDASRWWRTMRILGSHGFVTWKAGQQVVHITDAGRACVRATYPSHTKPPAPTPRPFTPAEQTKVLQILREVADGCGFASSRKFAGGTCAQESGKGFACTACEARDLLTRFGLEGSTP
jgi:hypothetical protein